MKATRYKRNQLSGLNSRLANDICIGDAVVPYNNVLRVWVLPDGPKQQNRHVKLYDDAVKYAQRINDILGHYPQLATRLARKEAA